jgi:putative photosynthetic complex assembly protein 2
MTISALALPILFTLFVWWFSTGVILYLDQRDQRTYATSFVAATLVAIAAFVGIAMTRAEPTVASAYIAFACSVLIWGWQEMAFLMGYVTGPRDAGCTPNCSESERFMLAVQAILYHELSLIASGLVIAMLTWHHVNQVATLTFLVLFVMRLSAKLNLFFGVRNVYEKLLPEHLRHLESYFKRRAMNLLFPVSVTVSSLVAALLWRDAWSANASAFDVASRSLIATLLSLAVLEHWFLVLPIPAEAAWKWATRSRETPASTTPVANNTAPIPTRSA